MHSTDDSSGPTTSSPFQAPKARDPEFTKRRTREAVLQLLKRGKWPSRTAVRDITRRGAPVDIDHWIREFLVEIGNLVEPSAEGESFRAGGLSAALVAQIYVLIDLLREESVDVLRSERDTAKAASASLRLQLDERSRALDRSARDLELMKLELDGAIRGSRAKMETAKAKLDAARREISRLEQAGRMEARRRRAAERSRGRLPAALPDRKRPQKPSGSVKKRSQAGHASRGRKRKPRRQV